MAQSRTVVEDILEELCLVFRKFPWWIGPIAIVATWVFFRFLVTWLFTLVLGEESKAATQLATAFFQSFFQVVAPFFALLVGAAWLGALILNYRDAKRVDGQKSIQTIRELSWREFELMLAEIFKREGYEVAETGLGADGGIDLILTKDTVEIIVQAKQWKSEKVGVKVVREFYGVQMARRSDEAIIVTSGRFTTEAIRFAEENEVRLIDGPELATLVAKVQKRDVDRKDQDSAPLDSPTPVMPHLSTPKRSSVAPACPTCATEMVKRIATKGSNAGNPFWGCPKYPGCRGIRAMVS